MTSLSEVCDDFQTGLEALEPADADLAVRFRGLITRLARDAIEHVAEHRHGEIPALLQLCHDALAALKAEAEDLDRASRYASRRAILNVLSMCDGIARFQEGKQKPADVAALRDLVADALAGLVEPAVGRD
jgi:hypothetical protein